MGKDISKKRDKRRRARLEKKNAIRRASSTGGPKPSQSMSMSPSVPAHVAAFFREWSNLIDHPRITTPATIDENIAVFCTELSDKEPFFIECQPESWSRESMCNVNVAKLVEQHGGEMLCGYRIWYNGRDYAEAERHAIWINGQRRRDVSFSVDGETTILFVPDRLAKQRDYDASPLKIRRGFTPAAQALIRRFESEFDIPRVRMSDAEGWMRMQTYEQFLQTRKPTPHGLTVLDAAQS